MHRADAYELAEALADESVICDTPRFRCSACRHAEAYPVDDGWRCPCGARGTLYSLRHRVARDRHALDRLASVVVAA